MLYNYDQQTIGEYIQFKKPNGTSYVKEYSTKDENSVCVHEYPSGAVVVVIREKNRTKEIISNVALKVLEKDKDNMIFLEMIDEENDDDPLVYY